MLAGAPAKGRSLWIAAMHRSSFNASITSSFGDMSHLFSLRSRKSPRNVSAKFTRVIFPDSRRQFMQYRRFTCISPAVRANTSFPRVRVANKLPQRQELDVFPPFNQFFPCRNHGSAAFRAMQPRIIPEQCISQIKFLVRPTYKLYYRSNSIRRASPPDFLRRLLEV